MTPDETVILARYVRALCPQQKFDEYTPDAWHDVLGDLPLDGARAAAATVARRQPFVSPAEIRTAYISQREQAAADIQGPGLPAAIPDADPDDVHAYLAAVKEQRTRAADGTEKRRPVAELLAGVGRQIPTQTRQTGPLSVACPYCGVRPLHRCRRGETGLLVGFHPSRIDEAKASA
ncbi:zinc finger domain-containing protein [Streptomyces coelicoflavus]|uniref:zinc finger domain-containing protein n=1 Tax=Streptomyces coelicoflavus TaxID=285562 RepID=UPI000D5937BF|nr:hypothetical protein [Streptomyces coelicoflavus]